MLNLSSCLIRDEHGATAIECAMLIVLVALAIAQALAGGHAAL